VNFTPKPFSKLAKKCPLKFSAFLNFTNIRSQTKFKMNKTMGSGRKNKQVISQARVVPLLSAAYYNIIITHISLGA
jgi:hypothetical protein